MCNDPRHRHVVGALGLELDAVVYDAPRAPLASLWVLNQQPAELLLRQVKAPQVLVQEQQRHLLREPKLLCVGSRLARHQAAALVARAHHAPRQQLAKLRHGALALHVASIRHLAHLRDLLC